MWDDMTEEERKAHIKEIREWFREYKREIAEGKRRAVVHARWQLEAGAPVSEQQLKRWREWDPKADHRVKK